MSISSSGNELETAAGQANVAATTQEENALVFEASEDRELHFVALVVQNSDVAAEVSFSSAQLLVGETTDETASGVLANTGRSGESTKATIYYDSGPPHWSAGEEINVHVNNFAGSETQCRVVIGYVPVGEFNRDRLRNR